MVDNNEPTIGFWTVRLKVVKKVKFMCILPQFKKDISKFSSFFAYMDSSCSQFCNALVSTHSEHNLKKNILMLNWNFWECLLDILSPYRTQFSFTKRCHCFTSADDFQGRTMGWWAEARGQGDIHGCPRSGGAPQSGGTRCVGVWSLGLAAAGSQDEWAEVPRVPV